MDVVGSGIGMETKRSKKVGYDTKQYKRFTICGIYCQNITDGTILEEVLYYGMVKEIR